MARELRLGAVRPVHVGNRHLDRLDQAIGTAPAHDEALADAIHPLVVMGRARQWSRLRGGRHAAR